MVNIFTVTQFTIRNYRLYIPAIPLQLVCAIIVTLSYFAVVIRHHRILKYSYNENERRLMKIKPNIKSGTHEIDQKEER
jgi:hypothetical protein